MSTFIQFPSAIRKGLTVGLAPLIVCFKPLYLRKIDEDTIGRFSFSAKSSRSVLFSELSPAFRWSFSLELTGGGFRVLPEMLSGRLAMERTFAFLRESAVFGIFLFGEKKVGQKLHFLFSVMIFVGIWLSGYFIKATNATTYFVILYRAFGSKIEFDSQP